MPVSSVRRDIVQPVTTQFIGHAALASRLCSLTSPQPHSLPVLLKFGDELIALLHYVIVLLVLIVWSIGLDDSLSGYTIDSAGDASSGDEFSKITAYILVKTTVFLELDLPV